jgi:hypothetical protein
VDRFLLPNAVHGNHGKTEHGFSPSRGGAKGNFLLSFFAPPRLGENNALENQNSSRDTPTTALTAAVAIDFSMPAE